MQQTRSQSAKTAHAGSSATASVREAVFQLLRAFGMTTIFGNPGSTELRMFRDWPEDFRYILGLQESVVVGMADAYAQVRRAPVLVNLHSAGGVGHALGAVFTAWRNQTPLVILAGQQTRAMLPTDPFLSARYGSGVSEAVREMGCRARARRGRAPGRRAGRLHGSAAPVRSGLRVDPRGRLGCAGCGGRAAPGQRPVRARPRCARPPRRRSELEPRARARSGRCGGPGWSLASRGSARRAVERRRVGKPDGGAQELPRGPPVVRGFPAPASSAAGRSPGTARRGAGDRGAGVHLSRARRGRLHLRGHAAVPSHRRRGAGRARSGRHQHPEHHPARDGAASGAGVASAAYRAACRARGRRHLQPAIR